MAKIIDTDKGSAITGAEVDSNFSTFAGKNQSVAATTHTIDVDDQGETIEYSNASPIAVTLPTIASVSGSNIHTDDFTVTLKNIGAGLVTVTRGGTDTFENAATSITIAQYGCVTLQTDSTLGKWNIIGRGFGATFNDSIAFAGTTNLSGTWQVGGTTVTSSAAELNYNDITTLGTVQASKTVTADASGNVTFNTSGGTKYIEFNNGSKVIRLQGNSTTGDFVLYDNTNSINLLFYDESANTITIAPPITASGGITADLIGNADTATLATTASKLTHRGALVYGSTTSVPDGSVATALSFPSEDYDTSSIHDGVNPTRLTVPSGATKVRLSGFMLLATATYSSVILRFDKNGSAAFNGNPNTLGNAAYGVNIVSPVLSVTAGDYFELIGRQSSGAARLTQAASWFCMEIVE